MKKKVLIILIVILLIVIFLAFVLSCLKIELKVKRICNSALQKYPESGDKIDALISVIQAEENCTQEKTQALWALGQLGDEKALDFLYENYGEEVEVKKSLLDFRDNIPKEKLCDFETQFAIQKIERGQFNIPAFLWRNILN